MAICFAPVGRALGVVKDNNSSTRILKKE